MNKNNCLLLYDLTEPLDSILLSLNTLYNLSLTEENISYENNVLLAQLPSCAHIEKIVTEINESFSDYRAISLKEFESLNKTDIPYHSLKKIEPTNKTSKLITDFDFFFTKIGGNLILYENEMTGKIKKVKEFTCKKYSVSPFSNFLALLTDKLTILCGKEFELYFEIYDEKITEIEFTEDEKFIIVYRKDFCTIYNLKNMNCVLESESTSVIYNKSEKYFYIPFLSQKIDLEGKFCVEKNRIAKLGAKNGMSAILTNDKKPKIIFKKTKMLEKTYPKILDVEFKFSKNYLYFYYSKESKDRMLYFLESYGESIFLFSLSSKITNYVVCDDFCVLFDENFQLIFLERKNNLIKEISRIKKKNKVYMDLNDNGVLGLYDYENDMIEFYYKGKLISSTSHNDCNTLKWSQNGCFLASLSINSTLNNLIQVFSANGNLLWKQNFYKLEDFRWMKYEEPSLEIQNKILNEYEERIKGLNMEILENTVDKNDLGVRKKLWISFLKEKKALVESILNK